MQALSPGEWAWVGLAGYVFLYDVPVIVLKNRQMRRTGTTDWDLLTDACRNALIHPKKKWIVFLVWAFTTKHLLFGDVLPQVDPFSLLGLVGILIDKIIGDK